MKNSGGEKRLDQWGEGENVNFRCSGTELQTSSASVLIKAPQPKLSLSLFFLRYFFSRCLFGRRVKDWGRVASFGILYLWEELSSGWTRVYAAVLSSARAR